MSKEYSKSFYDSKAWQRVSRLYMSSQNYICERCGKPGVICHHKVYITPNNINNTSITLCTDNLECLCPTCHSLEHIPTHNTTYFDENGNISKVRPAKDLVAFEKQRTELDELVERARKMQKG